MNRLKLFLPLILFCVLAVFFWRGLSLDPTAMPSALIDKPMPSFSLPELNNDQRLISEVDLKGEVRLLNIWGTWCVSCRVEHPFLLQLAEQGVPIVGVNYKDDPALARQWLLKLEDPYLFNIVDLEGRLGIDLGVFGAPETYLIDMEGVIRYKHVGVVDENVWSTTLGPMYQALTAAALSQPES